MSFKQLGLRAELLQSVEAHGYTRPTPIQAKAISVILTGRDILAGAQTGTGKTAAFTLPMLQQLSKNNHKGKHPRALVLTPTRELALQVGESVEIYGKNLNLRSMVIYGGVGINPQIKQLRNGMDILVATPGRLLDHANRGTVDLSQVEIFVLDEADRMLDMGFIHDLRRLMKLLPKKRQNLMFSATYSKSIKTLADTLLNRAKLIEIARQNTAAESVTQKIHTVERGNKRELLSHLIKTSNWKQVLVFTRTKRGANKLTKQLTADGVSSTAIHGDKSQEVRSRALANFKKGTVRTLIATDVAARGLDITLLPCVINFDLPHVPEDYVHRIGRTGRAGANGIALSLVCPDEQKQLQAIQKLLNRKLPVEKVKGFIPGKITSSNAPAKNVKQKQIHNKNSTPSKTDQLNRQRKVSIPGAWFAQV